MFTTVLLFLKDKLFGQTGSFLLPIVCLLGVFVIWNSDLILSKFGFETTTNLKAEVTRLKAETDRLKEANASLAAEVAREKVSSGVVVEVVEGVAVVKEKTVSTVNSIIDERKKKADLLLGGCTCDQEITVVSNITNITPTNPKDVTVTVPPLKPLPVAKKITQPVSQAVVDRLSEDNIDAIQEAYASMFEGAIQ